MADDVLCQVASEQKLQDLLDVASWWAGRKDGEWPVAKYSYLKRRGEGNGVVYLAEEPLREAEEDKYLGMTLGSEGLRENMLKGRVTSARTEVSALKTVGGRIWRFGRARGGRCSTP